MNVIGKPNLVQAALSTENSQLFEKTARWYNLAARSNFANFVELQQVFPSADLVGDKVVFNLGSYRLICGVSFARGTLYFKALLCHAEYDNGGWKS